LLVFSNPWKPDDPAGLLFSKHWKNRLKKFQALENDSASAGLKKGFIAGVGFSITREGGFSFFEKYLKKAHK